MQAVGCTQAGRATNKCQSTCGFTCGGGYGCCSAPLRTWWRLSPDQAEEAGDALMPAFTHFRPAQPVLVAHFFLSPVAALRRDFERLEAARVEADALPLGSGAIAGTAYAIDVQALARDLGFSRVVPNSIDASSDRDFAASFLYASALTMVHLSRLAEDLIIFCGDEHHFFDLSDALSTGSSMMPQKKNPDPLELVRGKSGRAIGHLVALLTAMKGLPSGYNKDLQEDKQAVFDAEDTLAGCLAVVRSVVAGLTLDRQRAEAAASGLLLATDVADYLVGRGVPFRSAHEIVGGLVRRLAAEHRDFGSLSLGRLACRQRPVRTPTSSTASRRGRRSWQNGHPNRRRRRPCGRR